MAGRRILPWKESGKAPSVRNRAGKEWEAILTRLGLAAHFNPPVVFVGGVPAPPRGRIIIGEVRREGFEAGNGMGGWLGAEMTHETAQEAKWTIFAASF